MCTTEACLHKAQNGTLRKPASPTDDRLKAENATLRKPAWPTDDGLKAEELFCNSSFCIYTRVMVFSHLSQKCKKKKHLLIIHEQEEVEINRLTTCVYEVCLQTDW